MSIPSPRKNDQVFQLSLTELAFTLILILLLLSGVVIHALTRERDDAREFSLRRGAEVERAASQKAAAAEAKVEIEKMLEEKGVKNEEIISKLTERIEKDTDKRVLQQRIKDMDAKLTALSKIEEQIKKEAEGKGGWGQIEKALKFQAAAESVLGEEVAPGEETATAEKLATAAVAFEKTVGDLGQKTKEAQDLRNQVLWLTNKINARGGRDYPPCWVDQAGNIQYIFKIDIRDGGLLISKAWPPERETDARSLPTEALLTGALQTIPVFRNRTYPLDKLCRQQNCRHYVILDNHVNTLDTFNKHRFAVEEFFYKYEIRR